LIAGKPAVFSLELELKGRARRHDEFNASPRRRDTATQVEVSTFERFAAEFSKTVPRISRPRRRKKASDSRQRPPS